MTNRKIPPKDESDSERIRRSNAQADAMATIPPKDGHANSAGGSEHRGGSETMERAGDGTSVKLDKEINEETASNQPMQYTTATTNSEEHPLEVKLESRGVELVEPQTKLLSQNQVGQSLPGLQTIEFSVDEQDAIASDQRRIVSNKTQPSARSRAGKGFDLVVPEWIGTYQIKRILGRGGMGVVYLAQQSGLNREVALKMILAGNHASDAQLQRFEAEARAVAKLQHPNIVQVYEVGEHDRLPYFSLEYVDGQSLDKRLDGKPIPPREAAEIIEKVCRAMQYAHERGVLHRDLKPDNILMTQTCDPKITDFGLAKQLDEEDSSSTKVGTIMGTPSYMSPEQAQGMVAELTPATDQYSLGAVLYEMLTGRPPFIGTKAFDTISQVVHKQPIPPCQLLETLPPDIDTICLKALQKLPEKRYASCKEMADDLGRFLRGEPILARPIGRAERLWRWCKRNPLIAVPSAAAVALLLATASISTWAFLSISTQAAVIAQERDTAKKERDNATQAKREAESQREIAVANEEKADQAKLEAERQQLLASEAQRQAEKNQKLAEQQALIAMENIQFFVTDIDERLAKQPGMSELRVEFLQVLAKKWDELDLALAGGIEGQAVPTLMAVRAKMADAWVSLDKLPEANQQYEALYKKAQERVVLKNRNDASRFNLAFLCVKWAGIRQRLEGDPKAAETLQSEANDLLREILKDPRPEPGSPPSFQVVDLLQQSLLRSASMELKTGHVQKAQSLYTEVEQLNRKVLEEAAQDVEWFRKMPEERKGMVRSYFSQNQDLARAGLANIGIRESKVEEAIVIFEQLVAAARERLSKNVEDSNARDQLALQLRNYGQNMLRANRPEDAVRLIGQAHDLTQENYERDPTNARFKQAFGYSLYYWAVAMDAAGKQDNALALFERSRSLRQEMLERSPDQSNKVNLMLSEGRLGNQAACSKWIDELSLSEAKDPDLRIDLARALAQLARQESDMGKRESLLTRAFGALQKAVDDGLSDPFAVTSEVDLTPIRQDPRFVAFLAQFKVQ